ncbi:MAG: nucleotidyltransferase family protein [Pseudomonadota bacterium]
MTEPAANIEVVLLAAGLSRRMGSENKLLLSFRGKPLVRHTASMIVKAGFSKVVVVTGHDGEDVEAALDGLDVDILFNPRFASGQMTSVVHGLRALLHDPGQTAGTMIALADMPYLQASDYRMVADAFQRADGERIIVPQYLGQRGNPIILPACEVKTAADGDINTGCRKLIRDNPGRVQTLEVKSAAFIRDIDTPADYGQAVASEFPAASCCSQQSQQGFPHGTE